MEVQNLPILVTGGNAGIGFALCKRIVSETKHPVILAARNVERGKAAVEEIKQEYPNAKIMFQKVDVSNESSVVSAGFDVAKCNTKLYAVVNNAGVGLMHGADARQIIETNVFGVKRASEAFCPLLDQSYGRVVNVGSGVASGWISRNKDSADARKLLSWKTSWPEIKEISDRHIKKISD